MIDVRRVCRLDVPFTVRCVHRLRFTGDVFGAEQEVLLDVLDRSGPGPVKAQFWLDAGVAASRPDLAGLLETFCRQHAGHLIQADEVQIITGGETVKNETHVLEAILKAFDRAGLDRRSYVVVIGGGAVLDAVGFAAAIAHRGLRLVRLPTTTLSQADSGLGVKNGVNLFGKKNWIGTFTVPWAVINDATLLETLPDREYRAGFAEVVKVALLKDAALFDRLCAGAPAIVRREADIALPLIRASAQWHLHHITRGGDPFEQEMARPLDFGHWSAHKLEALSGFSTRHGDAVATGVAIDCVYSAKVHGFPRADAQRVLDCFAALDFPLGHPLVSDASLFAGLEEFRQHLGGELTLTMLRAVAEPIEVHALDHRAMQDAIAEVQAFAREQCRDGETASEVWTPPVRHCVEER